MYGYVEYRKEVRERRGRITLTSLPNQSMQKIDHYHEKVSVIARALPSFYFKEMLLSSITQKRVKLAQMDKSLG